MLSKRSFACGTTGCQNALPQCSRMSVSTLNLHRLCAMTWLPALGRSVVTFCGAPIVPPIRKGGPAQHARWQCSHHSKRRRHVGLPKGVDLGIRQPVLTAEQSPWEDYLLPTLEATACPRDTKFFENENFLVLGVETSCDDTAAAVLCSDGTVLSDVKENQDALTSAWGGVVPHVARDAHENAIQRVIARAMNDANVRPHELHAVAATMGPGLEVCLRVGYRAARTIAREHEKDFVGVNHLEAHVLVPRLDNDIEFPFLTLLVSGGHCQLLLVNSVGDYQVVGGTLDDALGEAFDKTARLLGLNVGGGGGPALEALAKEGDANAIPFPVPMRKRADCNFSFAGLKTSVRTAIERLGGIDNVQQNRRSMADIAASFQETAVRHLEERTRRAMRQCDTMSVNTLVVSGGVAANSVVRGRLSALAEKEGWRIAFPPVPLCTDNGVMVAWAGVERLRRGMATNYKHLDVRARWPIAKFSVQTYVENELEAGARASEAVRDNA